jgi:hypothetical protein
MPRTTEMKTNVKFKPMITRASRSPSLGSLSTYKPCTSPSSVVYKVVVNPLKVQHHALPIKKSNMQFKGYLVLAVAAIPALAAPADYGKYGSYGTYADVKVPTPVSVATPVPTPAAGYGSYPKPAAGYGSYPKPAAGYGSYKE